MGDINVLIVDSEKDLIKPLALKLEKNGISAKTCLDCESGLKNILRYKPKVVLVDNLLDSPSALDMIASIRAEQSEYAKSLPIIIYTNFTDSEIVNKAKKAGCQGYIVKSDSSLEDIIKLIRNYC